MLTALGRGILTQFDVTPPSRAAAGDVLTGY